MRRPEGHGPPGDSLPGTEAFSVPAGHLSVAEAARYLGLPEVAVRALVGGGFLRPAGHDADSPLLATRELRAFMLWNVDEVADAGEDPDLAAADPHDEPAPPAALLRALEERCDEMAERAFDAFAGVFREAGDWPAADKARFVEQARGRLEAILAVSAQGFDVAGALASDLQSVGADAASDGATLPQLLVVLRISRDLVVQTAVDVAEQGRGRWGQALSLLLSRVLPVTDRLTDSLAKGYWSAVVGRQKEARARFQHVVEHASEGVYEVDLDGRIQYANRQLGLVLGRRRTGDLLGKLLTDVMPSMGAGASGVLLHRAGEAKRVEVGVVRPDGIRRVLDVRTVVRMDGDEPVGYQGVVRDVTPAHELGAEKDRLLSSLLGDLRLALIRLADLGESLESEAGRMGPDRLRDVGTSVVGNVEHLSDLTERVAEASRMAAEVALLSPRPVELAPVVQAALAAPGVAPEGVDVSVPAGLTVMADADGLVRVVRELVASATASLAGGRSERVRVEVEGIEAGELLMAVSCADPQPTGDEGTAAAGRDAGPEVVVRTLVEAMGGRVWHEADTSAGVRFRLTVPVANRRRGDEAVRL